MVVYRLCRGLCCRSGEDAGHAQQVARVRGLAAAGAHLEVKGDLVPFVVLGEVQVAHGPAVRRLQVAELKVVRRHEREAVGPRELRDGGAGADDAVGRVRALEDFIDAEQYGSALAAGRDHGLDA